MATEMRRAAESGSWMVQACCRMAVKMRMADGAECDGDGENEALNLMSDPL